MIGYPSGQDRAILPALYTGFVPQELGQYPAVLTSHLVKMAETHIYFTEDIISIENYAISNSQTWGKM